MKASRGKRNSLGGRDVRMVVEVIVSLTTDGRGEKQRYLGNSDAKTLHAGVCAEWSVE